MTDDVWNILPAIIALYKDATNAISELWNPVAIIGHQEGRRFKLSGAARSEYLGIKLYAARRTPQIASPSHSRGTPTQFLSSLFAKEEFQLIT